MKQQKPHSPGAYVGGLFSQLKSLVLSTCSLHQMKERIDSYESAGDHQRDGRRKRGYTTCSGAYLLQSCSISWGQEIALLPCINPYTINYTCRLYLMRLYCKIKMYACTCAHACKPAMMHMKMSLCAHMYHCRPCVSFCMCPYIFVFTLVHCKHVLFVHRA